MTRSLAVLPAQMDSNRPSRAPNERTRGKTKMTENVPTMLSVAKFTQGTNSSTSVTWRTTVKSSCQSTLP